MTSNAADMAGQRYEPAPFWEFYAVGDSALLAYHSCDGTEHKRVTSYDFEAREFTCTECGIRHADVIYGEPFLRDVGSRPYDHPHA
jgi:hypothetical protein